VTGMAAGLRDSVRTQLWPLPVAGVAGALVLGVLLPHLDAHVDGSLPSGACRTRPPSGSAGRPRSPWR
jgi:hypothetical protein